MTSLSIILSDDNLFDIIYRYLPIQSQIRIGLINKMTHKNHNLRLNEIKKIRDGAILSTYYMFVRDYRNELRVYNEYNTQYWLVLENYQGNFYQHYNTYIKILKHRYIRNWDNVRHISYINETYVYPRIEYKSFIVKSDHLHMLTNTEILEQYCHLLRMMRQESYNDINLYETFLKFDNNVIKTLGIEVRNNILMKDFAIIEFFLMEFDYNIENKLCEWLCSEFEMIISDIPILYAETSFVFVYKDGNIYEPKYQDKYRTIFDQRVVSNLNNIYSKHVDCVDDEIDLINSMIKSLRIS